MPNILELNYPSALSKICSTKGLKVIFSPLQQSSLYTTSGDVRKLSAHSCDFATVDAISAFVGTELQQRRDTRLLHEKQRFVSHMAITGI